MEASFFLSDYKVTYPWWLRWLFKTFFRRRIRTTTELVTGEPAVMLKYIIFKGKHYVIDFHQSADLVTDTPGAVFALTRVEFWDPVTVKSVRERSAFLRWDRMEPEEQINKMHEWFGSNEEFIGEYNRLRRQCSTIAVVTVLETIYKEEIAEKIREDI